MTNEYYRKNRKNLEILRSAYCRDLYDKGIKYAKEHLHNLCIVYVQHFLIGDLSASEVENYILSTID